MGSGISAERALAGLVVTDEVEAYRQVAMVDAHGGVAAHTGSACIPQAGQLLGEGFSAPRPRTIEDAIAAAVKAGLGEADVTWAALIAAREGADVEAARLRLDALLEKEPRYAEVARRLPGIAELFGLEAVDPPPPPRRR